MKTPRRDVFQAIADPTRREIIDLLAAEPLNLNAVANSFSISRPAISKHMRILRECGLVIVKKEGRERYCRVNFESLHKAGQWMDQYRKFWNRKMDDLGDFLEKEKPAGKPR